MTKDTGDLTQFNTVACREYTLPRDENLSEPKGWIQGNTKIEPVLEVATCSSHSKYGVEIRIMSLNRDNTHSWVRISDGSNLFLKNLIINEREIPEDQFEEYAIKLSAQDFAERTERPVIETCVIQARSSEDSKDPNVGKAHERTRKLVKETNTENVPDSSQTRSCYESETFNVGDKTLRERTGRPVVDHDNLSHEQTMVNKANLDIRIPGLPHSVVKHAQSTSVGEMIQKIENHPDRHALQQDLRQNQATKRLSPESQKMIQYVDNIDLFELLNTDPKTQCTACLSYCNVCIVYCTCGHFLQEQTEVKRKFVKFSMDLLSLPEYVIKKGRPHGHRYGKRSGDEDYLANQLK